MTTQPAPLAGIKVVDFGQGVAGPYCAQLLADHGADVIKVEPPRGDWSRNMGRRDGTGLSGTFLSVNRNKRGVSLDLKHAGSVEAVRELVLRADVVVESFRPGVMARFGLGYDDLAEVHPSLVYASVTGFGDSGPNVTLPAGDSTMQAYGGLMSIVGEIAGPPLRVGNVVSDMLAGTNLFSGVCLALFARERSARGAQVSTSLLDSMVAFQAPPITEFLLTGELARATGNQHPLIAPSGAFRTRDGWIAVTVLGHQWERFCGDMGLAHLVDDERFSSNGARQSNRNALNEAIAPSFVNTSTADALDQLRLIDVLCSPVNTYADLVQDPQILHNELLQSSTSGHPMVRNPIVVGSSAVSAGYRSPPTVGQHTRTVLAEELGWDANAVDELLGADDGARAHR